MYQLLIVDDEEDIRRGMARGIPWNEWGFEVAGQAENGEEAVRIIGERHPDVVLSDIRMPKMDGIEMLRVLREEGNHVSVIFLTAYSEFEYARNALKLLAFDYLLKPFEDGELEYAVSRVRDKLIKEREEKERQEESKILSPGIKTGDKSRYIKEAIAYITEHYNDSDLSVGTIAESLGISEGHLSHLFKKETDYTVMAYITRCRIREAMKLLTNCRYKVYEVGEMVGYRDITYFSSTFKKIAGVTPSEYQAANS